MSDLKISQSELDLMWHEAKNQHDESPVVRFAKAVIGTQDFYVKRQMERDARRTQPEATVPATIPKVEIELPAGDPRKVKIHLDTITDGVRWLCCTIESPAAQDLSAAILALPLPMPWNEFVYVPNAGRWTDCGPLTKHAYGSGTKVYTAEQMHDLLKAAAALASSANALSEGDRKDAELYREIRKWNPKQFTDAWARALSDKIKFDELVNAAIQAQKDGHAE